MIEVRGVSKSFGRVAALVSVDLRIDEGARVALVGTNGSGKTTLLRAMLGLVRVKGTILVRGVDVAKHPEIALRDVAHVPQIAPPIEAPLGELLAAWTALRGRALRDVEAKAERLGLPLAPWMKSRFRDLSGGMKQKVLAAMALAAAAPILVCDEPTANLDPSSRALFFQEVQALPRTSTVVLCSHRAEEVRALVDRVVEMGEGRVIHDGPMEAALGPHGSGTLRVA